MTGEVVAPERRAPRRRAVWAVLLGVLPLVITGTAVANAGELLASSAEVTLPISSASPEPTPGDEARANLTPAIAAPGSLEGADYSSSIQQITIKFPPPPEPAAPAGGSSGGGGSSGPSGGGGSSGPSGGGGSSGSDDSGSSEITAIDHVKWCANNSAKYASTSTSAASMLTAINKERARNSAPALKANSTLASNASNYSVEMAQRRDDNPDLDFGSKPWLDHVFYHASSPGAAENLFALSFGTNWSRAHLDLMESEGHCYNIMNPTLKTFGVGATHADNGEWYLTQRFGR